MSVAKEIALEAGKIMLRYFRLGVNTWEKEDMSVVTKADTDINRMVIERIGVKFPGHSVWGEEESRRTRASLEWVCDPIDGTVPFSKGVPVSVFSLALVRAGEPMVGVVYDPFTDRMYSAVKGEGAKVNGQPMRVSTIGLEKHSIVNVEWWPEAPFDLDTRMHQLSLTTKAYVLHMGCVINAACLVAAGQYEACVYAGTRGKNVDIAAVKVIVGEAGGQVTDLFGQKQRYDRDIRGALVSNGVVHNDILGYLKGI